MTPHQAERYGSGKISSFGLAEWAYSKWIKDSHNRLSIEPWGRKDFLCGCRLIRYKIREIKDVPIL